MSLVRMVALSVLMLAGASSAFAGVVASAPHRFTATFPGAVEQLPAEDNATNDDGDVISQITTFQDVAAGRYIVLFSADIYLTPTPVDRDAYMSKHVTDFLSGIKATGEQRATMLDGYPATAFAFEASGIAGQGAIVFVPGDTPRGYLVVVAALPGATTDDKAKLAAFVSSIDIQ
jgi:hypothetical protein